MAENSQAYEALAQVYDRLQSDHDVSAWSDYLIRLDRRFSRRTTGDGRDGRPLLLDLGCGTGRFCLAMTRRGYDCIGIDQSPAMLEQAGNCWQAMMAAETGADWAPPLFLLQDISRFELYGTVDLIVCLLDTVNHLTQREQVRQLFALCANYLNPGGLLVFDAATRYHLETELGHQVFYQDMDEQTLLWQNSWQAGRLTSRSEMILFSRQPDGLYQRHDLLVRERFYDQMFFESLIEPLPLRLLGCFSPLTLQPAREKDSRHVYMIRREAI